ncbi:MAG: hypothetical protein SVM79_00940 [Chloroflexota bacterium]|nr:hypothetical protein [Chloroflexota bacterium]
MGSVKRKWSWIVAGPALIIMLFLSGCPNAAKESEEVGRSRTTDIPLLDNLAPSKTATATFSLG